MTKIILRGEEMDLHALAIDVVVQSKIACVTVSAIQEVGGERGDPVFAHTHLVDLTLENLPVLDDMTVPAIKAFKDALIEVGGYMFEEEVSDET